MFMAHVEFVTNHPGLPRMRFGELQRPVETGSRRMAQIFIHRYRERLGRLIEEGKKQGELTADINTEASALLFIGTIQGLVMQSLLSGDLLRIRDDAPKVFAIYRRGIRSTP
jgi:hypothetical protein